MCQEFQWQKECMVLVTVPLNAFALCGRAGGHTMMKKLLLLVSIAVPREAVAEDAQCVRESWPNHVPIGCA